MAIEKKAVPTGVELTVLDPAYQEDPYPIQSGRLWTTPLSYFQDGEDYVVIAPFGGSPRHPAWYLNLQANPEAEVQVGPKVMQASARTAKPEERARLWPKAVEMSSGSEGYQTRTSREIPLVLLRPQ